MKKRNETLKINGHGRHAMGGLETASHLYKKVRFKNNYIMGRSGMIALVCLLCLHAAMGYQYAVRLKVRGISFPGMPFFFFIVLFFRFLLSDLCT